ncbi:MAG: glycerate kinase [Planctomycetota bacterium]
MRQRLERAFRQVLPQLDPAPGVRRTLDLRRDALATVRDVVLVAIGKAARPMAQAALQELQGLRCSGLCITPAPDGAPLPPLEVLAAGHPLPDAASLRAGERALEVCWGAGNRDAVLFLLSGGGSALCDLPLDDTVTLAEWQRLHRALIGCGAGIEQVNTVRMHLSATKGGRLALAAASAEIQLTLAVSDVPGDLSALASGPTMPTTATLDDCRAVVDAFGLRGAIPASLLRQLDDATLPPLVRPNDPCVRASEFVRLLDNDRAIAAMAEALQADGLRVVVDRSANELPCDEAARVLLRRLADEAGRGTPVAVVAGGEVRVALPAEPGTGGRNQQFALQSALAIAGRDIAVLSCGTDGQDGSAPAAGAFADGTTVARATALGLDAAEHLRRCDAHPVFEALGDAIVTGPTGTNVRDVRVLVHA